MDFWTAQCPPATPESAYIESSFLPPGPGSHRVQFRSSSSPETDPSSSPEPDQLASPEPDPLSSPEPGGSGDEGEGNGVGGGGEGEGDGVGGGGEGSWHAMQLFLQ